MNIWLLLKVGTSLKTEFKIAFAALGVIICMPMIAVVVVANAGVQAVSNTLAALNPVTHLVEIFNPDGTKVAELSVSTVWPARGYVSDEFGAFDVWRREHASGPHTGTDIADEHGEPGEPVTPFMQGKVKFVHDKDDNTCGKWVRIDHGNHIQSLYCHLSETLAVEGADVKPGDVIGLVGSTGLSTNDHLHFQVEVYGIPVNARTFMVGEPQPGD